MHHSLSVIGGPDRAQSVSGLTIVKLRRDPGPKWPVSVSVSSAQIR